MLRLYPRERYGGKIESKPECDWDSLFRLPVVDCDRVAATVDCSNDMMTMYLLDGNRFSNLDEFYDEISRVLIPGAEWGRNLDAFNDILRGGFGTPEDGFRLRWINSERSRQVLAHTETIRQLEKRLQRCHPTNRDAVAKQLAEAKNHRGPTVFDWLVEIIERHGVGGLESADRVELVLE